MLIWYYGTTDRIDGSMFSRPLHQILTLPSECCRLLQTYESRQCFFQSSVVKFWWNLENCSLGFLFLVDRSGRLCGVLLPSRALWKEEVTYPSGNQLSAQRFQKLSLKWTQRKAHSKVQLLIGFLCHFSLLLHFELFTFYTVYHYFENRGVIGKKRPSAPDLQKAANLHFFPQHKLTKTILKCQHETRAFELHWKIHPSWKSLRTIKPSCMTLKSFICILRPC